MFFSLTELTCRRGGRPDGEPRLCDEALTVISIIVVGVPAALFGVHLYMTKENRLQQMEHASPIFVVLAGTMYLLFQRRSEDCDFQKTSTREVLISTMAAMSLIVVNPTWQATNRYILASTSFTLPLALTTLSAFATLVTSVILSGGSSEVPKGRQLYFVQVIGFLEAVAQLTNNVALLFCPLYVCMMPRPGGVLTLTAILSNCLGLDKSGIRQVAALTVVALSVTGLMIAHAAASKDDAEWSSTMYIGLGFLWTSFLAKSLQRCTTQYAFDHEGLEFNTSMTYIFLVAFILTLMICLALEGSKLQALQRADFSTPMIGWLAVSTVAGTGYYYFSFYTNKGCGAIIRSVVGSTCSIISVFVGTILMGEKPQAIESLFFAATLIGVIMNVGLSLDKKFEQAHRRRSSRKSSTGAEPLVADEEGYGALDKSQNSLSVKRESRSSLGVEKQNEPLVADEKGYGALDNSQQSLSVKRESES